MPETLRGRLERSIRTHARASTSFTKSAGDSEGMMDTDIQGVIWDCPVLIDGLYVEPIQVMDLNQRYKGKKMRVLVQLRTYDMIGLIKILHADIANLRSFSRAAASATD
jgi:hypothetical protein